ncbi:hypothetical protein [Paenarthrobacter sp. CCNWLY172]|uniref:hypothetical protein n=1 Tax=Paenarthrobacter sp. CCNWLY172 TaxID=3128889 RepID=UPI00307F8C78
MERGLIWHMVRAPQGEARGPGGNSAEQHFRDGNFLLVEGIAEAAFDLMTLAFSYS